MTDGKATGENPLRLSRKELGWLFLLTVFAILLIFRHLGSRIAPETGAMYGTRQKQDSLVMDFGNTKDVSMLQLYLGYESDKQVRVTYRNSSGEEWIPVWETMEVSAPFRWQQIPIYQSLRYLRLEFLDEQIQVMELVVLDSKDQRITPILDQTNEKLFDESDAIPKDFTSYNGTMFDEVYYARTAYEFLMDYPIYETTHPPLGKILIAGCIRLFGLGPFGWRFASALAGVLLVPLSMLFMWKLSDCKKAGILTGVLFLTGFMHLTLSRIATLDSMVALFVLTAFYWMLSYVKDREALLYRYEQAALETEVPWKAGGNTWKLWLCGTFMGISIATKWTGVYAGVGLAVLFFASVIREMRVCICRKGYLRELILRAGICVGAFVIIPAGIYLLSFLPFQDLYPEKSLWSLAVENSRGMLQFHQNVFATHPYQSAWYQWLVDWVPLLDSYTSVKEGTISVVATFGNPLLIWGTLPAILYNLWLGIRKKDWNAGFLLVGYFAMLLPWLLVRRTVFIYQYYISGLFGIVLIVYSVCKMPRSRRAVGISLVVISVGVFILFYPVLTGVPVSQTYVKQVLQWLPRWKFT